MKTILILEDEPITAEMYIDMAKESGFSVIDSYTGDKVKDIVQEGVQIDLLITDCTMPGMNGDEAIEYLERNDIRVPTLLTSSYHAGSDGRNLYRFADQRDWVEFSKKQLGLKKVEEFLEANK